MATPKREKTSVRRWESLMAGRGSTTVYLFFLWRVTTSNGRFSYTVDPMSGLSSWTRRLSRLWFLARSFPLRARFMTGKASFVEADVRMTTNSLADVAGAGEAPRTRLLAHYQLETRPPRAGLQGWTLYDERVGGEVPH